jgi:L-amino acid N-acyltransferase YncA
VTPALRVRPAGASDAEAIAAIYNQGIEDRLATLETAARTAEDRRAWLAARDPRHPVLVAEEAGLVVGWASLNGFNPRPAYDAVADFSIYVLRERRGQGIGGRLLAELVTRARSLGYHKLVLAALAHNAAGRALYETAGFREVGIYREQGRLDGRFVDVLLMERILET